MKKIYVSLALALLANAGMHAEKSVGLEAVQITSCTPITTAQSIDASGPYCFANDITGQIVVTVDNVILDLGNFRLTGNAGAPAIVADGVKNITIQNGFIENPGDTGNPDDTGMALSNCDGITLANLTLNRVDQAIILNECFNGSLSNINANGNTSTKGFVIDLTSCDTFTLTDINASNCIKNRPVNLGIAARAIVGLNGTFNATLTRVITNNSEIKDDFTFYGILAYLGDNITLRDCESNGTFDVTTTQKIASVIGIALGVGNNFTIINSQANGTFVNSTGAPVRAVYCPEINGLIIDGLQVNNTTINDSFSGEGFDVGANGLILLETTDFQIRNVQANNTTHNMNQPTIPTALWNGPIAISIQSGKGVIEKSQANNTTVNAAGGESRLNDAAVGLVFFGNITEATVRQCEASGSNGGEQGYGFIVISEAQVFFNRNSSFIECTSSNNSATEVAAGFVIGSRMDTPNNNANCDHCISNDNRANKAYGFAFENTFNSKVTNSSAAGNTTSGFFFGPIQAPFFEGGQVNNTNLEVVGNSAQGNGTGFLFDPASLATNVLVENNTALGNAGVGFEQRGQFDGDWVSNYARGNNPNYCISSPIQLFAKTHAHFKHLRGDKRLVDFANISAQTGKPNKVTSKEIR